VDFIEGGWPGSNPKDAEFFERARALELDHARITAFSSTRKAGVAVEDDAIVQALLDSEAEVVTLLGKKLRAARHRRPRGRAGGEPST